MRYFLFIFFALLFLFYPGNSYYFHIFAYNRSLFNKKEVVIKKKIYPVPYLYQDYYPKVSAQGIYVVDLPSFTPIFKRNSQKHFYPASTTKIITALVALDVYKPDQIITVRKTTDEGQKMGLVYGEKISIENLLYGMLVYSGNDAAYALADDYGFDKYISLMNKKVQNLKMENTHFINPAGFDNPKHYSSPFDLALAARELLKNKYLSKIASTKEITVSDVDFKYFHRLTNINKLIGEIQGVGGLKTGYTENAGENLVSFYKRNRHRFLIVVLKSEDRFQDTRNIIRWIEENIKYYKI